MTACLAQDHATLPGQRCPWCCRYVCAACGRAIPKARKARWMMSRRIVGCLACNGQEAHARIYPDCPETWHDVHDHSGVYATYGGLRRLISEGVAS